MTIITLITRLGISKKDIRAHIVAKGWNGVKHNKFIQSEFLGLRILCCKFVLTNVLHCKKHDAKNINKSKITKLRMIITYQDQKFLGTGQAPQ